MNILLLILSPIGDTLFTTPSLKALRKGFPEAYIEVMGNEKNEEILRDIEYIDKLRICKNKSQLISKLYDLREIKYDLAIGLSNRGSYFTYMVNADKKAGFKARDLGWFYDYNLPDNRDIHAVDYCLKIVEAVGGIPDENPEMEIPITDTDRELVQDKLKMKNVKRNFPLIAIHPGGKFFTLKRWPREKFKELVKVIDSKINSQIVFLGGPEDEKLAEAIIDRNYKYRIIPKNFAGQLSLKESAALLELADVFVGNDSAPQHIASCVKTPVVSLCGPTNPVNFHPYGTKYKIIQAENINCSPCFYWLGNLIQYLPQYLPEWANKCDNRCMENIEVNEVFKYICFLLSDVKQDVMI